MVFFTNDDFKSGKAVYNYFQLSIDYHAPLSTYGLLGSTGNIVPLASGRSVSPIHKNASGRKIKTIYNYSIGFQYAMINQDPGTKCPRCIVLLIWFMEWFQQEFHFKNCIFVSWSFT